MHFVALLMLHLPPLENQHCGASAMMCSPCLHLNSLHPLGYLRDPSLCKPPPHSPLLCLIPRSLSSRSPGMSKRLGAIKYSSALINCSSSPFWRRRRKGRRGGRKNDIELFRGPQSGAISGNRIDLDETAQRAFCVCVFLMWWLHYICVQRRPS